MWVLILKKIQHNNFQPCFSVTAKIHKRQVVCVYVRVLHAGRVLSLPLLGSSAETVVLKLFWPWAPFSAWKQLWAPQVINRIHTVYLVIRGPPRNLQQTSCWLKKTTVQRDCVVNKDSERELSQDHIDLPQQDTPGNSLLSYLSVTYKVYVQFSAIPLYLINSQW